MASAEQLKALVRSHADGDDSNFYSVAMQVAARAARSGQTHFAQELRDLVDSAKAAQTPGVTRSLRPVPVTQPKGDLSGLLAVSYPDYRLSDLVVDDGVRATLERVLSEQRQRDRLREHGFDPIHSLLLVGPPGTGKTLTAGVLAGELRLPLFVIRLDALMTKYMGETASKLRLIFDEVSETRGVYLFDEVDALAGDRSNSNDVGEIRRVLSSFLQFLEGDVSASLVVATTNHPQLLDRAIFRRFAAVVDYPLPAPRIAQGVIKNRLTSMTTAGVDWKRVDAAAAGLSHGELTIASEQAAKESLLANSKAVSTEMLIGALEQRRRSELG